MDSAPLKFKVNSSSGFSLIALGAIALLSGIYHQSPGGIAIGVVLLSGPAVVYVLLRKSLRGISLERSAPESAFEGDSVEVAVRLTNGSNIPLFQPEISDIFAPELHAQKGVLFTDRVRPGETVEKTYDGACILPRGVYALGPLGVSISDPFGWFQLRRTLRDSRLIKVYPAVQTFGTAEELGRCLSYIVSELTHKGPGDTEEFFAVRDYQRGDPLRRVHWGLTAHRGGQPVVREFAKDSAGDLNIFVDRHRRSLIGIGRGSSLEHAVKIAAALSAHSLARGHRVHLVTGDEERFRAAPGTGRDYLRHILEVLVRVRPADSSSLNAAMRRYSHDVLPGSTALVTVSPYLYGDSELLRQLAVWRRKGVRVLAVVFDAESFRRLWEHRTAGESSGKFAAHLRERGVKTYVVPCAADLRAVFTGGWQ